VGGGGGKNGGGGGGVGVGGWVSPGGWGKYIPTILLGGFCKEAKKDAMTKFLYEKFGTEEKR